MDNEIANIILDLEIATMGELIDALYYCQSSVRNGELPCLRSDCDAIEREMSRR